MKINKRFSAILSLMVLASMAGCGGKSSMPNFELLPNLSMMDQKSLKAGEEEKFFTNGAANRVPPENTLARDQHNYPYTKFDQAAVVGKTNINPLPRSRDVVARGQKMYNIYCMVCHGPKGKSDGSVIPKFPMPPTLHSEKVRTYPDGAIYHVIAAGQNLMPSYASQIDVADRWAIVHYVRALQAAVNP